MQLCLPAGQSHTHERLKSPICMDRVATIFTGLTPKIFDHIRLKNHCDPTPFITLSVH